MQILTMICNETTEFCAPHGEKEEEGPAEVLVAEEEDPAESVAANEKSDEEMEEEAFARYRQGWECSYGDSCSFEDLSK